MWRFKRIIYVSNIACGCSVDKAVLIYVLSKNTVKTVKKVISKLCRSLYTAILL